MKEILKRLEEHLKTMTREELYAEYEAITHEKFYKRWVEKFHNLDINKRILIIEKIIAKYNSDTYIDREYKIGYEPRTALYDILFEYAAHYGKKLKNKKTDYFPTTRYEIDGYIAEMLIGQGTVINVYKKQN